MNTNDLNTALYEKMAAEQDKFRDWLKSQPPEEVLNHAYEYTIREDIVMAIEELELTDTQAQAHAEAVVAKSTRTSVLDSLKRPVTPRSTDKKPKQHEEVR